MVYRSWNQPRVTKTPIRCGWAHASPRPSALRPRDLRRPFRDSVGWQPDCPSGRVYSGQFTVNCLTVHCPLGLTALRPTLKGSLPHSTQSAECWAQHYPALIWRSKRIRSSANAYIRQISAGLVLWFFSTSLPKNSVRLIATQACLMLQHVVKGRRRIANIDQA